MIRRFIFRSIQFIARRAPEHAHPAEPWKRVRAQVGLSLFGKGADRSFQHYLAGTSAVDARSVDEVCVWLSGCTYVSDEEQFCSPDHWQHPVDFEQRRSGDCEDFALWAWRKLIELGYSAYFLVGKAHFDNHHCEHAWVMYQEADRLYFLETVEHTSERMILAPDQARSRYSPFVAVNQHLQTFVYRDFFDNLKVARIPAARKKSHAISR